MKSTAFGVRWLAGNGADTALAPRGALWLSGSLATMNSENDHQEPAPPEGKAPPPRRSAGALHKRRVEAKAVWPSPPHSGGTPPSREFHLCLARIKD